ncbi:unnamed protein product, partial [Prorocentrum cordatum]
MPISDEFPMKIAWMVFNDADTRCDRRKALATEMLDYLEKDEDDRNMKLQLPWKIAKCFEDELKVTKQDGTIHPELFKLLTVIVHMIPVDTQAVEGMNSMIKFIIKLAPAIGLELLSTRLYLKKELAVLKTTRRQSIPPGVLKDLVDESAKNHEDNMKALQQRRLRVRTMSYKSQFHYHHLPKIAHLKEVQNRFANPCPYKHPRHQKPIVKMRAHVWLMRIQIQQAIELELQNLKNKRNSEFFSQAFSAYQVHALQLVQVKWIFESMNRCKLDGDPILTANFRSARRRSCEGDRRDPPTNADDDDILDALWEAMKDDEIHAADGEDMQFDEAVNATSADGIEEAVAATMTADLEARAVQRLGQQQDDGLVVNDPETGLQDELLQLASEAVRVDEDTLPARPDPHAEFSMKHVGQLMHAWSTGLALTVFGIEFASDSDRDPLDVNSVSLIVNIDAAVGTHSTEFIRWDIPKVVGRLCDLDENERIPYRPPGKDKKYQTHMVDRLASGKTQMLVNDI